LLLKSDFYMATRMSIAYTPSGNTPFKHQVSDRKLIVNGVIFDSIDFATAPIRPQDIQGDRGNCDSESNPLVTAFRNSVTDSSRCGKIYNDLLKVTCGSTDRCRKPDHIRCSWISEPKVVSESRRPCTMDKKS
jgi:hypothetical protein